MTQGFDELAKLLDEHEFFSKMKNSDKITLALLFTEVFKQGAASRQAEIDELQKRINDALDMLEGRKGKVLFDDIVDTLKGDSNE